MTFTEFNLELNKVSNTLDRLMPDILLVQAMNEVAAEYKDRIYGRGKDVNGQDIGEYSAKEYYASKESFVRKGAFKNVGKTGKATKSTMFFKGGYKEFRQIQGRKTDSVNLKLSGDLEASNKVFKFGDSVVLAITDQISSDKKNGMEKKYGSDTFNLSLSEEQMLERLVGESFEKAITKNV